MKKFCFIYMSALLFTCATPAWSGEAVNQLLQEYSKQAAGPFSKEAGAKLWTQKFMHAGQDARSCATCHTADPTKPGKHIRTGKPIQPLAPSVNPKRLSEMRKINKWLYRNCKWTLGRACNAQEKGDVLTYLNSL